MVYSICFIYSQSAVKKESGVLWSQPQAAIETLIGSLASAANKISAESYRFMSVCEQGSKIMVKPTGPLPLVVEDSSFMYSQKMITAVYLPVGNEGLSDEVHRQFVIGKIMIESGDITTMLHRISRILKSNSVAFSAPFSSTTNEGCGLHSVLLLFIIISLNYFSILLEDMPSKSLSSETDKWKVRHGIRLFSPRIDPNSIDTYAKNPLASFLIGDECRGDALLAFVEPTELNDVSIGDFFEIVSQKFPGNLMGLNHFMHNLPLFYSRGSWNPSLK